MVYVCYMKNTSTRQEVYAAIDSEREYQDAKWGHSRSGGDLGAGERSVDEFALYLHGYVGDLTRLCSHELDKQEALNIIRKIGGLAVACLEQHGAPLRDCSRD